jgi:hypothetical protein
MSAHICSDATTNLLAQLAPLAAGDSRQSIAELLRAENTRSVNFRYRSEEAPEPIAFMAVGSISPVGIVKLCHYFDYQACETDDYHETRAAKIIEAIRTVAVDGVLVEQDRSTARGRPILDTQQHLVLMTGTRDERLRIVESLADYESAEWGLAD